MKNDVLHGIAVRPDAVDITTLRQVKDRWEVKGSRGLDRSPEAAPDEAGEEPALLRDLAPAADELEGACSIALPAHQVLLRVVDLPTPDPDEIEGMIELQVDKFSPFPVEHLIVSYEKLQADAQSTRVLIAAVQREKVEELEEVFRALGSELWWIDVDLLGWRKLLADEMDALADEEGVRVTLLVQAEDTRLIVSQGGVPVLLRSLSDAGASDSADYATVVAEEIDYTLTSLEAEWGLSSSPEVVLWHEGPEPEDLLSKLSADFSTHVVARPLSSLPPLSTGLALRAAEQADGTLNLAPPEWKAARETRKWRKNLIVASSILLTVWLITVVAFTTVLGSRKSGLARLDQHAEELAVPAAEVKEIQEKVGVLERYKDRSRSALEIIRLVTLALPEHVELSNFTYRKGTKLTLRGEADREPPIYDFFQALQDDPLLGEVTPGKIETSRRPGGRAVFTVSAQLGEEAP